MNVETILNGISYKNTNRSSTEQIEINGLTDDSREVKEGYLFVAVNGETIDGHQYIDEAIENGASVIIGERPKELQQVAYFVVDNTKKILGQLAKNFYRTDDKKQLVIGITGTNGKTTTSYMVKSVLEANGQNCGVIGTIQNMINGEAFETINTTPNPVTLHRLISESNDDIMIIEVSSHALKQYRVEGVEFDIAIFTNLEKEHLDYHDSMEEYFETKYQLFTQLKSEGLAIVNRDNSWGEIVYRRLQESKVRVKTISTDLETTIQISKDESSIYITKQGQSLPFELSMPGEHNRLNAAMTLLVSEALGFDRTKSMVALKRFSALPGRFESIYFPGNIWVIIDYAHTTKGIYYCLKAAREYDVNRIIHVFGFRGGRDQSKRADMLINSAIYSDQYILTFDDLNETPAEEMKNTIEWHHEKYGYPEGKVIPDRTLAIQEAIQIADSGDVIVITGKGHEKYQQSYALGTLSDRHTVDLLKKSYKDMKV